MSTLSSPHLTAGDAVPTLVVGVGASAGGLRPMQEFLVAVPTASGMAFVVVQHLDPDRPSLLVEILSRFTTMEVLNAEDRQTLRADCVYVIPPGSEIHVMGGALHLCAPQQTRGLRLPIDVLFTSMAQDLGRRAVGVVLSGLGADGTLGMMSLRAHGGLALVQRPDLADFDAMPLSALAGAGVGCAMAPADMPAAIAAWQASDRLGTSVDAAAAEPVADTGPALQTILRLLKARTSQDLSLYKPRTLLRRIARRMALHAAPTVETYADLLAQNPQEIDLLFKELLIGVTAFFRDAAVWKELQDSVLPVLLARRRQAGGELRAWVAGCSTGEEVYSLAMALTEALEADPGCEGVQLRIFGTDLSADAVAASRRGFYAAPALQGVSPGRRARFFKAQPNGFTVTSELREKVLFAQHNLAQDPPFTRLDLLLCRNLMIYFDSALQQRLVPLFHYSLRPGGLLWLGSAETTGGAQHLFTPLRPHSRQYWRVEPVGAPAVVFPSAASMVARLAPKESSLSFASAAPPNLQSLADQLLLQSYSPPAVLVTASGDIVYISGRTGRYLEPASGKADWNIHAMARPGLRVQLSAALRTALQDKTSVELKGQPIEESSPERVDIAVRFVPEPLALQGMLMVVFIPVAAAPVRRRSSRGAAAAGPQADDLSRALADIRALREELQASKEEMQAAVEEMQSTNEELQASNEELTTSKEEGQSMNEELQTINAELQSKLDELALAQSDMQNLLNSTQIATLFLDKDLCVRRFTAQIERVFHLRKGDVGRPLSDLASRLDYPQLHADVAETLRSLRMCERTVRGPELERFSVRIMPYRTLGDVIQGVVLTFMDVSHVAPAAAGPAPTA